jgi:hypothetical protein
MKFGFAVVEKKENTAFSVTEAHQCSGAKVFSL